jgi:hypothetical protein
VTQANPPPGNPARFNFDIGQLLEHIEHLLAQELSGTQAVFWFEAAENFARPPNESRLFFSAKVCSNGLAYGSGHVQPMLGKFPVGLGSKDHSACVPDNPELKGTHLFVAKDPIHVPGRTSDAFIGGEAW